ncbi:hypothetical protein B0H13DRAFT_1867390 [Mycena leptocephala]|nr:hypothetical protein B0H13DRAFT_1867390 [Mycena leptocephala]
MGRHAKHLSLAQQASASRQSSLKYVQSPQYSGRITRAASRWPAQRRKVPPAPPGTLPIPVLPMPTAKMLEVYEQALPHAYLAFTKSLAEVLHGVRLREQNVRDIELREGMQTKGRRDLWDVDSVGAGRKNAE